MADTLRSLAGAAFSLTDVLARPTPIPPEQAVLDRYVFVPHVRTGIAAAITTPFAWDAPTSAEVVMGVPVHDDEGSDVAEMTVHVYGPGDVRELDPRQVIRTWPRADAHDTEVDDLVQIEFDRPEVPWLFTPAAPIGGRLTPWITLVVARADTVTFTGQRGATRIASIRRDQLQSLRDAWAWAHAQVMGAKAADPSAEPTLARRLGGENAPHNLSRVVCPRRLGAQTRYIACVVPTFLAGSQAGRGLTERVPTLAPSWGTAANFDDGDPMSLVDLPVYYTWSFATGESGNFESLARRLRPAVAPPAVGRRRVDATRPWADADLAEGDPGAQMVVEGPMVSPQDPADYPEQAWPSEAEQQWAPELTAELTTTLNRPDQQSHEVDPGPPLVGPPIYASHHAKAPRIETGPGAEASQPPWFRELNLDPRARIVAGLGTRVVQAEQEDLMRSAWNQVAGVEAANRSLRLAQLAEQVSASLHRRHLARFSDGAVLAGTERVHAKLRDETAGGTRTVWAAVDASALPVTVTTGAFRRLARVRGPVARFAVAEGRQGRQAPGAPGDRARVVDSLTVSSDGLTTSWVRQYAPPDGVVGLGAAARAHITPEIAAAIDPTADPDGLMSGWERTLSGAGLEARFDDTLIERAARTPTLTFAADAMTSTISGILAQMPDEDAFSQDEDLATLAVGQAFQVRSLARLAARANVAAVPVRQIDARRFDLPAREEGRGPAASVTVELEPLLAFTARVIERARGSFAALPLDLLQGEAQLLQSLLIERLSARGERVAEGLKEIASRLITADEFAEPDRSRLAAPALDLVGRLDPHRVVPARVRARLTLGSGRLPSWVRPDWFDNDRVEPVMACPRFAYPMYEPLDRYDRNWLIPGLGLIERPDMATLLVTNSRFVEAYLVGLNHEMGRELLWREYPTDQRGTYFSSFWTGQPELVADLHELPWRSGNLKDHITPGLDGQLVLLVRGDLVRRYPGVVAHAVRQAQDENGNLLTDNGVPLFEPGSLTSPKKTLFHLHLPPNLLLVGFALTEEEMRQPGATWWFTLSENPTEPRFGLDEPVGPVPDPPPPAASRDDLTWGHFGVTPGGFLDPAQHTTIQFTDAATGDPSRWGASSAQVAQLLFQLPARAAFSGLRMVDGARENR